MEIISLTPAAQQQAKALLDKEIQPRDGLRIKVVGGGCSGLQYHLGWDEARDEDLICEYENGLVVLVDQKSALYLKGCTLEFHNSIEQTGFEVQNPNANNTCGCGKSFS